MASELPVLVVGEGRDAERLAERLTRLGHSVLREADTLSALRLAEAGVKAVVATEGAAPEIGFEAWRQVAQLRGITAPMLQLRAPDGGEAASTPAGLLEDSTPALDSVLRRAVG